MQKTVSFNYLYLNYVWEINQLIYPFELGLLISHAQNFQVFNAADNLKASRNKFILRPQRKFYQIENWR